MSDVDSPQYESQAATDAAPPLTAGQLLRQAREAAGVHIGALAVSMKVPLRKLEALEADRLDQLPGPVFARALAYSMCRALKIDPQPVLDLLPRTEVLAGLDQIGAGINAPFDGPSGARRPAVLAQWRNPAVIVVAVLGLGIATLLLWPVAPAGEGGTAKSAAPSGTTTVVVETPMAAPSPVAESTPPTQSAASAPVLTATLTPVPAPGAVPASAPPMVVTPGVPLQAATNLNLKASAPAVPAAPAPKASAPVAAVTAPKASAPAVPAPVVKASAPAAAVPVVTPAAKASAPAPVTAPAAKASTPAASAPVVKPAASAAAAAPTPASSGAPSSTASANGLVVFRAKGESWVEVTDATGTAVLRRLLKAGEVASASGTPPLNVRVGAAAATEVEVRGKPFNLAPMTRDNIARFEVK